MDNTPVAARYVLFSLAGKVTAFPAAAVAEVLPVTRFHRPAGSPKVLAGFVNLAGEPLPVISAAALFGGGDPASDIYRHVIRVKSPPAEKPFGLLVDRVLAVQALAEEVAPLEPAQSVNAAFSANLRVAQELVPLLDPSRLLLVEEQTRLDQLSQLVRERLADWTEIPA